jgi:hypothetical protein
VAGFIGRERELAMLDRALSRVQAGAGPGVLAARSSCEDDAGSASHGWPRSSSSGRVCRTCSSPHPRNRAQRGTLSLFTEAVTSSDLPDADVFRDQTPTS